jgi:enoyl-CoA hydratase/carnithine racemase
VNDLNIRYAVADAIATITFDRAEKLNALTRPMIGRLVELLDLADRDDAVRAVIVTGNGRAFCAGADLSQGERTFDYEAQGHDAPARRDWGGLLTLRIFENLKPIIAAVNGPAVGVGATLQLPMDVRMASTDAKFGFVFARRGIVPESASSWFLPRIVGISTALEWAYSGRLVPAEEALARGLITSVHAPDDLLPAARAMAHSFTQASAPVSVALTRRMMWRMLTRAHPMEAHRAESLGVYRRGQSADAREGIAAFKEKRPAEFTDRVSTDLPDLFPGWIEPEY